MWLSRLLFNGKTGSTRGRGALSVKRAPVGFKKGYGAVGLGRHTKKGFFHVNQMLVPMIHVPDLTDFQLQPYVSRQTPVINKARGYWRVGKFPKM